MVYLKGVALIVAGLFLAGCKPSSPEKTAGGDIEVPQHGFMLTQSEFNGLSPDDQFVVANKALSTVFNGLPMDEFFDLPQGLDKPVVKYSNFIDSYQQKLSTSLSSEDLIQAKAETFGRGEEGDEDYIQGAFRSIDSDRYPQQVTMAKIQGYPLSRNVFNYWMSYFLSNTIMFSPALEMDSTDSQDVGRVLAYLELNLTADTPIRDVIKGWLGNLSRWRVSRSPENHALEMFELYLGVFNDSPEEQQNTINGGKACSAWYLTDDGDEYQLKKDPYADEGVVSVKVFGKLISSCGELYDVVAGHPKVIPRVTEVIVSYFLDGSTTAAKQGLIQSIVNTGPVTFQDIFIPIIFSKEFLLKSTRPKTFEENMFGFLHSMNWTPRSSNAGELDSSMMVRLLSSHRFDAGVDIGVHRMGWSSMDSKIGRTPFIPMDALSFAKYHKSIREEVLLRTDAFAGCRHPSVRYKGCYSLRTDEELDAFVGLPYGEQAGAYYVAGTENLKPELEMLTASEFVDFVFLTALGRRATQDEMQAFLTEAGEDTRDSATNAVTDDNRDYIREDDNGVLQLRRTPRGDELWESLTDDFAKIMLDYISRLPEFYYYRSLTN